MAFSGIQLLPWRTTLEKHSACRWKSSSIPDRFKAEKACSRSRAVPRVLKRVGLAGCEDKFSLGSCPAGYCRQRASIWRALIHKPGLANCSMRHHWCTWSIHPKKNSGAWSVTCGRRSFQR